MEVVARQAIRVRVLANDPFLWCWDLEDPTGRRVESSWDDHGEAFGSPEEARSAGLARLRARVRPGGAKAAARFAKSAPGTVIIRNPIASRSESGVTARSAGREDYRRSGPR